MLLPLFNQTCNGTTWSFDVGSGSDCHKHPSCAKPGTAPAHWRDCLWEAFPQRVFRLTPGYTGRIFRVSYRDLCYSVLPCSDRDTIVVLPSLTAEKVGLPGSELPRSRSVMMSRCKQWFSFDSTFCTLVRNRNFSLNGNLQLKYETTKYDLK